MGSVKHGALACGMRRAADEGADIIIYTDQDLSSDLRQIGLLLEGIITEIKTSLSVLRGRKVLWLYIVVLYVD